MNSTPDAGPLKTSRSMQLRRLLQRTPLRKIVVARRHRGLDDRDVFLASYPKSGNTWVKAMLGHMLAGAELEDFRDDNRFVPSVGLHESALRCLPSGGRLIKTHEPYRPEYRRAIYVLRDGRDVAVSYYFHYLRAEGSRETFSRFLHRFLEGRLDGWGTWSDHAQSWMNSGIQNTERLLVIRYEDLRADCTGQVSRMSRFLGLELSSERIAAAVASSSLERMRSKETAHKRGANSDILFARKGQVGGWTEHFSKDDERLFLTHAGDCLRRLGYPAESTE